MKKILFFAFILILKPQTIFASHTIEEAPLLHPHRVTLKTSPEDQLVTILNRFAKNALGESVTLPIFQETDNPDEIKATGRFQDMENFLARLGQAEFIRGIMLPLNHEKTKTTLTTTPIDSWDAFMKALGLDVEEYPELKGMRDDGRTLYVPTNSRFLKGTAELRWDMMTQESDLFPWAKNNIPGLIEAQDEQTLVHYHLLTDFLYVETLSPDEICGVSGDEERHVTYTLSRKSLLKHFIAATCGNISLVENGAGGFNIQTISLGKGHTRPVELDLVLDQSGSMGDRGTGSTPGKTAMNDVNELLSKVFKSIQGALPEDGSATITVYGFNNVVGKPHTYEIHKEGRLPKAPVLKAKGGTVFANLQQFIKEGKVIIVTDGKEQNKQDITTFINAINKKRREGRPMPELQLFKAGKTDSQIFIETEQATGGTYHRETSVRTIIEKIAQDMGDTARARVPLILLLDGQPIPPTWIYDDVPGIYSTKVDLEAGKQLTGVQYGHNPNTSHTISVRESSSETPAQTGETPDQTSETLSQRRALALDALNERDERNARIQFLEEKLKQREEELEQRNRQEQTTTITVPDDVTTRQRNGATAEALREETDVITSGGSTTNRSETPNPGASMFHNWWQTLRGWFAQA